jgi:pre-rRNA-processing protein TSR3
MGDPERAKAILAKLSWGIRFLEVNQEPLDCYAQAKDSTEVVKMQSLFL